MPILLSDCPEVQWQGYGFAGEPVTPPICTTSYGCECLNGYPKPSTSYNEYIAYIPWNYVSSGAYMTDCNHGINDPSLYKKILYDKGKYIQYTSRSACEGNTLEDISEPETLIKIVYYPGGSPGHQLRTKEIVKTRTEKVWSSYYNCWRITDYYSIIYRFTYWIYCYVPNGIPDAPDGWEWGDDGVLVPPPPCIEIIGPTTLDKIDGDTYTFTAKFGGAWSTGYFDYPVHIILEYGGSSYFGDHYTGPISVTIPAGSSSVDFTITLLEPDESQRFITISGYSEANTKHDKMESCGTHIATVRPYLQTSYRIEDTENCCDFVTKNFIPWKNGFGIKKLIRPIDRD